MVKFAHLADCHLGSWRLDELQRLNFDSFKKAVDICINERVDFVLICGDLFDSAYPPIEILKESFAEFKKLFDARIPVYLIAGSHDFSASGKTFLDVLEKAGFCKNVENSEVKDDGTILLKPTKHNDVAIYGYPGRKSGMEVEDLSNVAFDSINPLTIFMIHTTVSDVVGSLPIDSVDKKKLPLANYYAMGHIHQVFKFNEGNSFFVYPGPTYPNNFQELVDLKQGSFEIVELDGFKTRTKNVKIPSKGVEFIEVEIDSGLVATQKIISEIDRRNLLDKVVLLKLKGTLKQGKSGDIQFHEIEEFVKKKGAYAYLKNISSLKMQELEVQSIGSGESDNVEEIEKKIFDDYSRKNPTDFNKFLPKLISALSIEKNEDEKSAIFENRLLSELNGVLELGEILK